MNPRKLRYPELREVDAVPEERTRRWEAAVVAEVSMSAMRAPRSRSIGGARHRSRLSSAEHGNPVAVRWESATGRPTGIRLELRSARPAGLQLQAASGLLPPATQRNWVAARLGVTLRDR